MAETSKLYKVIVIQEVPPWRLPDGTARTRIVGMVDYGKPDAPGTPRVIQVHDDERYPDTRWEFQWDGTELKATKETEYWPEDEWHFMYQLTRPLLMRYWTSLFADPDMAEKAYATFVRDGRNQLSFGTPKPEPDGTWSVRGYQDSLLGRFTLKKVGNGWQVIDYSVGGGLP